MAGKSRRVLGAMALVLGALGAAAASAGELREVAPVAAPAFATQTPYDPVTHALALGLTPARADARVDAALKTAETCALVFDTRQPIPHCWEGAPALGS
ncbi:hypothetical protein [Thioclava atlantica]|uniref:UrcA family protein n=1 Tax=Thioclava atlantica TaxID=1317124 RepID=A0A085TUK7_9RHOB|nr:hypothetical protein [Thioclava atlantica]KFE34404.1 hypothetical protein DW2_12665 [Thioclava atlantica]